MNFSIESLNVSYLSGTLTPSGTVSVDCGNSKTFTCNVTSIGTNPIAGWRIMNLVNIVAPGTNGFARLPTMLGSIPLLWMATHQHPLSLFMILL